MRYVVAWALLSGCVKNPATGRLQLDLMGEETEIRYGLDADASLSEQIGLYADDDLQAIVSEVGAALAAVSERPGLPWSFRVLDDATVNAFAVPGGHVYVTRGLLAHLCSTDELAVVLGHEIGHVAARHSVVQLSKGVLLGVGVGAVSVFDPDQRHVGKLAARGAEALFLSFSRSDELAADALGVRYVAAIGRAPGAFLPVFDMLQRVEDAAVGDGDRLPTRLRTHPQSVERRDRIAALVGSATGPEAAWIERLDGVMVGQDPREGYLDGRTYLHPRLGFRLDLPEGWAGEVDRGSLVAVPPTSDALIQVSLSDAASADEARQALCGIVRCGSGDEGGLTFTAGSEGELGGYAIQREHRGAVIEIVGIAPAEIWAGRSEEILAAIASFGAWTAPAEVAPMRLAIRILDAPTTLRALDAAEPSSVPLDALAILNQVDPDGELPEGRAVKRVVGGVPGAHPR